MASTSRSTDPSYTARSIVLKSLARISQQLLLAVCAILLVLFVIDVATDWLAEWSRSIRLAYFATLALLGLMRARELGPSTWGILTGAAASILLLALLLPLVVEWRWLLDSGPMILGFCSLIIMVSYLLPRGK